MPKAASYYAVAKGRQLGVFNTWTECEAQITGVSGAKYKKFKTEEEAEKFVKENDLIGRWNQEHNQQLEQAASSPPTGDASATNVLAFTSEMTSSRASSSSSKKHGRDEAGSSDSSSRARRRRLSPVTIDLTETSTGGSDSRDIDGRSQVISVYCDGAASKNGKQGARAGYGVWFADDGELSKLNESKRLPGDVQTNNRAELMAAIRAVQIAPPDQPLIIHTDSRYTIDTVTTWIGNWRKNRWITSMGAAVQNRDLIRRLDKELKNRPIRPTLKYVKGHAGIHGNEMADRLAVNGSLEPFVPGEDIEPPPSDDEQNIRSKNTREQSSAPKTKEEAIALAAKAWESAGFPKEVALRKAQNSQR
ncbi:unnamed protein product [Sympodiomycopsis kandeliae]